MKLTALNNARRLIGITVPSTDEVNRAFPAAAVLIFWPYSAACIVDTFEDV